MANNNNRNQNENRNQNQKQNQTPNDMREEFGSTFDVTQLKEQSKKDKTRNKNDFDPGTRNF